MYRRKRSFYGHTFVVRKNPLIFAAFAALIFIFFISSGIKLPSFSAGSGIYKKCLRDTIALFEATSEKKIFRLDMRSLLAEINPVIKAEESLKNKYALRYGLIKENESANERPKEDVLISDDVIETDFSAKSISYINPTDYVPNTDELLSAAPCTTPVSDAPKVLICHTHTSEAYAESEGGRSEDAEKNVVSVGSSIAETLTKNGVGVIHDTTRNDYPSYNGSYKKSLETVTQNLEQNPSIEVVLDIHRDYMERDSKKLKPTAEINGEKCAQVMFVIGTDSLGLYHPDWQSNLSLAVKLENLMLSRFPSLCRPINIRTERFNQHLTKGSMIIEVGTSANTLEEAKRSGRFIGEALAEILKNV